jgi:hypothetical protein
MKKSWMFLLLIPAISFAAAFPIYEEEYGTEEMNEEAVASEQQSEEDSLAADNDVQEEEVIASPQRRYKKRTGDLSLEQRPKTKAAAPSAQKKPSTSKLKRPLTKKNRSSVQGKTAARTKMKDARQNSDRPRVTHRGQEQKGSQNVEQVEADALTEESVFEEQAEQPRKKYQTPKARKSPAVAEKKTGQAQRGSSQKKGKGKSYAKKVEKQTKSHRFDKRPLSE